MQHASVPILIGSLAGAWVNFSRHRLPAIIAALCIVPGIWQLLKSEIYGSVCPGGECIADGIGLVLALAVGLAALGFLAAGGLNTLAKDEGASSAARRAARIAKPLLFLAMIVLMASATTFWPFKSREEIELTRELHAKQPDPQHVSLRGTNYWFPRGHMKESLLPPRWRFTFIRVRPPGADYDLILDELSQTAPEDEGPRTSRYIDEMIGKPTVVASPAGPVMCDETIRGRYICGLRVDDARVRWNVVFEQDQVGQAKRIRSQAIAAIHSYHSRA